MEVCIEYQLHVQTRTELQYSTFCVTGCFLITLKFCAILDKHYSKN